MPVRGSFSESTLQTKVQEQFCLETRPEPCGLVIFGASGDLAERKLFPSLFDLRRTGLLPARFYAVGLGRTAMTDDGFRQRVHLSLKKYARNFSEEAAKDFLSCFYYHTADYNDSAAYKTL